MPIRPAMAPNGSGNAGGGGRKKNKNKNKKRQQQQQQPPQRPPPPQTEQKEEESVEVAIESKPEKISGDLLDFSSSNSSLSSRPVLKDSPETEPSAPPSPQPPSQLEAEVVKESSPEKEASPALQETPEVVKELSPSPSPEPEAPKSPKAPEVSEAPEAPEVAAAPSPSPKSLSPVASPKASPAPENPANISSSPQSLVSSPSPQFLLASKPVAPKLEEMLVDMDDSPAPPPRKPHPRAAPPPIPSMNTIISKPRTPSATYVKGQVVRQAALEPQTLANQVMDLMSASMSKAPTQPAQVAVEKAEWVQLASVEKAGEPHERLEVLIVGLARGYQIWTMSQVGEFEEVLSERQGPVRALKVLPNNLKLRGGREDKFADCRPLIAVTDASSHIPDRQYCSVSIMSLVTGKEVYSIRFDEPVCAINVSDQFLVVSLSNVAYAYDILTFDEVRLIRTAPPAEYSPPALALSCQMLAFADRALDVNYQSSGGLAAEVETTTSDKYTDQLYNAMNYFSRGVKSLTESVAAGSSGSSKNNQPQGIITVLNLSAARAEDDSEIMCHYVAHVDPISYIAFSPDQRLVLSADANANVFNIFLLMPHPTTSSLAAVQHLYKLNRGTTPARVVSTSFSEDCRWLAISTNHGTTHVFTVCPFGGKPNQRTHGDTFVNKESRFHRSAGLTDAADVTASIGPSRHRAMADNCSYTKDHPVAVNFPVLAKTNGNTRIGPFPPPLLLVAIEKIKDSRYTKEDLTAWAADMTSFTSQATASSTAAARRRLEASRMSVMFRMKSYNSTTSTKTASTTKMLMSMSLMIAKVDPAQGVIVVQHEMKPIRKDGEINMEAPAQVSITPIGGWILQRTKNNTDMHAPMPAASPLMANAIAEEMGTRRTENEDAWTPHVETKTFLPPHRWIWQGPQFELFEYKEEDQPCLMSPGNKGSNASFKSIPVMVGSEAIGIVPAMKAIPADATRIECGSYTSANSYSIDQGPDAPQIGGYTSMTNGDFEATIADAMRDITIDSSSHTNGYNNAPPKTDDLMEEFFDTESSTPFARNGSSSSSAAATNGKATKKKKTPPASAPLPSSSTSSVNSKSSSSSSSKKKENGSSRREEKIDDADDFGTFDMDDI